jgi:hypothetical protein
VYVVAGASVGIGAATYGTFPPHPDGTGYGVGEGDGALVYAPTGTFAPEGETIVTRAVS